MRDRLSGLLASDILGLKTPKEAVNKAVTTLLIWAAFYSPWQAESTAYAEKMVEPSEDLHLVVKNQLENISINSPEWEEFVMKKYGILVTTGPAEKPVYLIPEIDISDPETPLPTQAESITFARFMARNYEIPEKLFLSLLWTEGWDCKTNKHFVHWDSNRKVIVNEESGTIGIAQIMPSAHRDKAIPKELEKFVRNLGVGACILRDNYQKSGSWEVAVSQYKGESKVGKSWQDIKYLMENPPVIEWYRFPPHVIKKPAW